MQRHLPLSGVLFLGWAVAAHAEGLVDVYRLAEQNDASLRAAAQARLATREAYPQARAQLLPNVALSVGINRDWLEYPNMPARDGSFTGKNYTLNLSQPLFDRARLVARDQAEGVVRQADVDYANSQQELMLRAAEGYFTVLRAQAELRLAEADLAANESRLAQTEKRFEVGLIAITDLADARAARDQALARRISAEASLADAHEALRVLTAQGVERLDDVRVDLTPVRPDPVDPAAWVSFAEQQNLALQSARLGLDIARQEIEKQRSGHYPTVSLNASYGYQDTQFAGTPLKNYDTRVGVQLNVPLYAGGGVDARVREATYKLQRAQDLYEASLRDTTRATRDAFRAVTSKISEIAAFEQAVKSAETQLAANEAGYEVGTRTIVDVITAQSLLTQARRNLFNARYDYLLATLRLKRAAGTLQLADLEALQRELR
ncbi:MAG: TolC family outer membrane protein [Halothiobacillaceae bacterium]|jgi:outer membrane protein